MIQPWEDDTPVPVQSAPVSQPWEDGSSAGESFQPQRLSVQANAQNIERGVFGDTDPVEQRLVENSIKAFGGVGVGQLAGNILGSTAKLFQASPDLLNAGIKPATVLKMTPKGQNPAEFGAELEDTLNKAGAIGKDAKDTFDKMYSLKEAAGQQVGQSLNDISQAAQSSGIPNPLELDAQSVMKPIVDGWVERASGGLQGTRRFAKPFEEAAKVLGGNAQQQGGVLTLDNVRNLMDEVGPLTHKGAIESQEAYSDLYKTLADARDSMVQAVAKNANDPALAENLLNSNKDYSRYIRLMPDISKAAAHYAVKQGVSTFQKFGGPKILEYATGIAGLEGLAHVINHFTGNKE